MDRSAVQQWLDRYVAAWRANEAGPNEDLFTEDAPVARSGRIVASWLEEPDDPDARDAHYEPYAVEGDRAVAAGWSRYPAAPQDAGAQVPQPLPDALQPGWAMRRVARDLHAGGIVIRATLSEHRRPSGGQARCSPNQSSSSL